MEVKDLPNEQSNKYVDRNPQCNLDKETDITRGLKKIHLILHMQGIPNTQLETYWWADCVVWPTQTNFWGGPWPTSPILRRLPWVWRPVRSTQRDGMTRDGTKHAGRRATVGRRLASSRSVGLNTICVIDHLTAIHVGWVLFIFHVVCIFMTLSTVTQWSFYRGREGMEANRTTVYLWSQQNEAL